MQQPPNNQPPPYGNQPSGNQPQYGGQPPANQPPPYGAPPQYGSQPPQYGNQSPYGNQQQYGQSQYGGGPPLDVQPQEDSDKIVAALSYFFAPLLGIIVLVTDMKNKPFLKFHAYQSITFGVAMIILWTIASFLTVVLIGCLLMPVLLGIQIWFSYQAYAKGVFRIPVVTDLTYNIFKDTPRIP